MTLTRRTEDSGHAKDMDVDKPETSERLVNAVKAQPSESLGILTVFQRLLVYGSRRFLENASSDKVAGPREA